MRPKIIIETNIANQIFYYTRYTTSKRVRSCGYISASLRQDNTALFEFQKGTKFLSNGIKMAIFFSEIAKIAQRQGTLPPDVFHDTFSTISSYSRRRVLDTVQTSA